MIHEVEEIVLVVLVYRTLALHAIHKNIKQSMEYRKNVLEGSNLIR